MGDLISRNCPVCGQSNNELLFHQMFKNIIGIPHKSFKQEIVICSNCGMVYVDNFLSDVDIEKYYTAMSNYEYSEDSYEYHNAYKERSKRQVKYILSHTNAQAGSVLDIGCSVGYTLHLLKKKGFNVLGNDPSPACSKIAKQKYGVNVHVGFFEKTTYKKQKFDFIILSHVIEHLKYPLSFFSEIKTVLNKGGMVFIEIPCTDLFDERDICQFFFEHINYFSAKSLLNMMSNAGYKQLDSVVFENSPLISPYYPTLGSLWVQNKERINKPIKSSYKADKEKIKNYENLINSFANSLEKKINNILKQHKKIGIWCAGTLTAMLLAQTKLLEADIVAIFDNDPKKDGQKMSNIPVIKPKLVVETFKDKIEAIIIGSRSSQEEIYHSINFLDKSDIKIYKLF